jgi:hypothetical protein
VRERKREEQTILGFARAQEGASGPIDALRRALLLFLKTCLKDKYF